MSALLTTTLSSATKNVAIGRDRPTVIIGERINPTGRKKVLKALQEGDFDVVRQDALAQVAAGAHVLDVNAGVPGADEPALLVQLIREVMAVTDVPLCIDTANPDALAAALAAYDGKALVNSTNGETHNMERVLPLAAEHGAAVIALCMDQGGIPATPQDRLAVADRIIRQATKAGIPIEDIVVDPLAMTVGADHTAARTTLDTISLLVEEFGVNITMGASNVSFGMPDRIYINATFLAMAILAGLTCPITNPLEEQIALSIKAADLAMGRDKHGMSWIKGYRARQRAAKAAQELAPA